MKYLPVLAGFVLGALFLMSGLNHFLKFIPMPETTPPPAVASFMAALMPTGYMTFIKVLETLGGALVLIPKTRNLGLLVLGPILVNIYAFHIFLTDRSGLKDWMTLTVGLLALFLLWVERRAWAVLVTRPPATL